MLFCDCGSRRAGPLRECRRCAGKRPAQAESVPRRGRATGPTRVVASGKTCPKCGEVTYLSRAACGGCGHTYRTLFQNPLTSAAASGIPPDRPPPEASALRAKGAFLLAAVLMTALAAGLIFYFVNYY